MAEKNAQNNIDPLQININLLNKYVNKFSFFESKVTNQLIYNMPSSLYNIQYREAAIFSEDFEVMRRFYRYFTNYGRPQIKDRIKALTGFYQKALVMTYEYPTMIVTSYRSIYQRRLRRMRKMVASDGSSDYSEDDVYYGKYNNTFSSIFLNQNDSEVLSGIDNNHNRKINLGEDYFDKQGHCIYNLNQHTDEFSSESFIDQLEEEQDNQLDLKHLTQDNLSHLMCDFEQIDEFRVEKQYKILQQRRQQQYFKEHLSDKKTSTKQLSLDQIQQYQKVNLNTNQLTKLLKIESEENQLNPLSLPQLKKKECSTKQNIQISSPHFWPMRLNIPHSTQKQQNYQEIKSPKNQREFKPNIRKQLAIKRQKKQKIRDKATDLLNRLKAIDYSCPRNNLNKQVTKDQGSTTVMYKKNNGSEDVHENAR